MSDTIYSRPGETFYSELDNAPTGLVGTVGVRIIDKSDESEVLARTTAGIVESPEDSGRYVATLTAPESQGDYTVFWDTGEVSPATTGSDDLVVTFTLPTESGGGTGGTVQLQYAQNVSNASNLSILKGSTMVARKVAS